MLGKQIRYTRLTSSSKNGANQLSDVEFDKVFNDEITGKTFERTALDECISYCSEGDTLHIHSLDMLARNLRDLNETVSKLVNKGVEVKFYKENITFNGANKSIVEIMLNMMKGFADFEAAFNGNRRKEGIEAARRDGKPIGRPSKLTSQDMEEILALKSQGVSNSAIAKQFEISRTTLIAALKN